MFYPLLAGTKAMLVFKLFDQSVIGK